MTTFFAPTVPGGVTIVIWVAEFTTKLVTAVPPTVTEVVPQKLVPVRIEVVPPETSPTAAVATEVSVGAGSQIAKRVVLAAIENVAPAAY